MRELLDCYLPVFKQVMRLVTEPTDIAEYEASRQICIERLEQAMQDAYSQDVSEEEKDAARFAVVAWLDETILCSALPWRHLWQGELLQRKYLDITVAGERFFSYLDQLAPDSKQARKVFLFCLQNGFHGQYSTPDSTPALLSVVEAQRQLCLPQAWQAWPNDAAITPYTIDKPAPLLLKKHLLLSMITGVFLLYGALFFLLHHYVR